MNGSKAKGGLGTNQSSKIQGNNSVGSSMMAGNHDNSKLGGVDSTKPYSEKVDLNDLDWEDRERVLRLLFSKMNAGAPANVNKILQQ